MSKRKLAMVSIIFGLTLLPRLGGAQEVRAGDALPTDAKCLAADRPTFGQPVTVTREQADAILSELKQVRELLEKQQAQLARALTPQPAAAPPPPEKVQMNVRSGWYSLGPADAPVTLVEFGDYQCSYCKRFHTSAYSELKKNYIDTGKVRFVSRDLPLEFHPLALKAAEAVRCASDQGKYWELRNALYSDAAPPDDSAIKKAAESIALDLTVFQTCLTSDKYKADVEKDASDAAALQITGTPTFVLAKTSEDKLVGMRIIGAQSFAWFQSAIDALLKN